jgi:hypothetical protein
MECAPLGSASMSVISQDHLELAYKCGIRNTSVKCFERINMYKKGFYVYSKRYGTLQLRQQNVVACKTIEKRQPICCVWEVEDLGQIDFIPLIKKINFLIFIQFCFCLTYIHLNI